MLYLRPVVPVRCHDQWIALVCTDLNSSALFSGSLALPREILGSKAFDSRGHFGKLFRGYILLFDTHECLTCNFVFPFDLCFILGFMGSKDCMLYWRLW